MASITITIEDIVNAYCDPDADQAEFESNLGEVAGIIESAIDNAFGAVGGVEMGQVSVEISA